MFSRIPRLMIVVLSVALLVVLAVVMDGSSFDNTAQAGVPVKPEMSLSANGPGVTCDSQPSEDKGDVPKPLKCDVPLGGTFNVSIEINAAPASGYDLWETDINYGALIYKKAASAADEIVPSCPGILGSERQQFSSSRVTHICDFELGNKTHDIGNIVELEFNCTTSNSSNVIELIPFPDGPGSFLGTGFFTISPSNFSGSNVDSLGINCLGPDGSLNINVVDANFQSKKLAGSCWLISVVHFDEGTQQFVNKPYAVLADNNAKPACDVPIKGTLVDKNPAVGKIDVNIPSAAMATWNSTEWHFQQIQTADNYTLDPTKYSCRLSGLFVKTDGSGRISCDEADPYVIKNVFNPPPKLTKPGDTDGDGCPDEHENRDKADASQGGGRDYLDPNDYYDVYGPNSSLTLDGVIDLPNDILGVIQHFAPQGQPPYDVRFDRGPQIGANVWNMGPPDGVIDLPNDILGVIQQFQHNCV